MNDAPKAKARNVIIVNICAERWTIKTERSYKEKALHDIVAKICALLNSGGGKLTLSLVNESNHHQSSRQRIQDTCVRMIEQRILEFTNLYILAAKIAISYSRSQIIFDVDHDEKQRPCTLNYNMYLPSQTQVLALQGSEMLEKVTEVVQGGNVAETVVLPDSHQKTFIQFEHVQVQQSNKVQFKNLKAKASKCVKLGDRLIGKSNKFSCYVSAFANHSGGHIYYGINDEGDVEGEQIDDRSKDEVIRKVKKTIGKMVYPKVCNRPRRGENWEIFFEPVLDTTGHPILSTFVIVIFVAHCPGGVFTEEPESYHIVESQVTKMSYDTWFARLTQTPHAPSQTLSIPHPVRRTSWSSNLNKSLFQKLTTRLKKLRNQGDTKGFSELSKLAKERFPESDVNLIVEAEETVIACKQNCLGKALKLQKNFAKSLTSTKDPLIYEVRSLHLQSMIKRRAGEYEESYKLAEEGLQKMQLISPGLSTVWFYIHAAMVALDHLNQKQDLGKSCSTLKQEARRYLDLAERDAHSLEDSLDELSDIQQKLHIYKAFVSLDCSVTGEMVLPPQQKKTDTIQAATKELAFVYETALIGNPLTPYREVQYLFSKSDLFYRRAQGLGDDYATQNAKRAFELVEKSLRLAKKQDFQDMIQYASKRRANITEKLIRMKAVINASKKKSLSQSLGFLEKI